MAVQPNSDGYLIRTSNLPSNSAGWGLDLFFRRTGSVGSGLSETLIELSDDSDGDYVKVYMPDTHVLRFQGINDFEDVELFTPTINVWYYLFAGTTSSTAGKVMWRTMDATSLSSSTGRKFQTDNGWDRVVVLNNGGFLEPAAHFEAFCLRMYIGNMSDAQVWERSVRMLPRLPLSALDSHVPLITNVGTDMSGRGRSWTVTGTLATVATQPRVIHGGSMPPQLIVPSTATAPVTLPLVEATASPQAPSVTVVQPVTLPLAAATATALEPAMGGATQPVTLPLGIATAQALQFLAGDEPNGMGRRSGRGRWRAERDE